MKNEVDEIEEIVWELHELISTTSQNFINDLVYMERVSDPEKFDGKSIEQQYQCCARIILFLSLMTNNREDFEEIIEWWNKRGLKKITHITREI